MSGDIVPSPETTPPGGTGLLSTASTFDATVGSHWNHGERPLGYYMDFRGKAPTPEWPPAWMAEGSDILEVAAIQWALGAWEHYVSGEGDEWRDAAIAAAEDILERQVPTGAYEGSWLQWRPMPHTYRIDPPWASGIAQGEAASLFARLHQETGEVRWADAARRSLAPMRVPVAEGGLLVELENGLPFFEEYPTIPPSMVLNGEIFALWGFRDAGILLPDAEIEGWWRAGLKGLLSVIERYDTGNWSRYDLYPHPVKNIASGAYHSIHIKQLEVLEALSSEPVVTEVRKRFERYERSRLRRARAFDSKVAFRLLIPRNKVLARTPLNGRARRKAGDETMVVLCYHAISEEWRSELTIHPEQLEHQVSRMLKRGYRPATFTDAVLRPRKSKTMVVTFDDAYASVGRLARPILDRLGVPATVFAPTAFPGKGEPMAWPGIAQWSDGPHSSELLPLNWEELAELSASGWEIGSHTRTHPRLTELGDSELAEELLESRLELERRLGVPCRSIAYPYGDYDRRVGVAAANAGYAAGTTLPPGPWDESRFGLPRVGVYGVDTPLRFRLKVSRPLRWVRRTPYAGPVAQLSRVGAIGPYEFPS